MVSLETRFFSSTICAFNLLLEIATQALENMLPESILARAGVAPVQIVKRFAGLSSCRRPCALKSRPRDACSACSLVHLAQLSLCATWRRKIRLATLSEEPCKTCSGKVGAELRDCTSRATLVLNICDVQAEIQNSILRVPFVYPDLEPELRQLIAR